MALSPAAKAAVLAHFLKHLPLLRHRDHLLELLTGVERIPAERLQAGTGSGYDFEVRTRTPMYAGKLLAHNDELHAVTGFTKDDQELYRVSLTPTGIPATAEILLSPRDAITVTPDEIANLAAPLTTSAGRVLLNYVVLVDPFGAAIPFQDKVWKPDDIGQLVANQTVEGKITPAQLDRYAANIYFLGHACELAVPVFSKKVLMTSPEVRKRREELLRQHAEALAKGDAVVMSQIEQELIALDKEWFKNDPASGFLIAGKNWNVHRKKMFGTGGMVEGFGEEGYAWISQPLAEGWDARDMPVIANEVRRGSYGRAKETAKGGEEAKFLMRVFQNVRIIEEDCRSTKTVPTPIDADTVKMLSYRTIIDQGKPTILTPDLLPSYRGKIVNLRTPMACQSKGGYCYACMGEIYHKLGQDRVVMDTTRLAEWMTTGALKSMHGSSVSTTEITSLNSFCF